MNIVIIVIILIVSCCFAFLTKKSTTEHFTLVPIIKPECTKTKLSTLIEPQTIECKTVYEIEKDHVPEKEITINEIYTLEKPDIQYYHDIQEEYDNRLAEFNFTTLPQITQQRIIQVPQEIPQLTRQIPRQIQQQIQQEIPQPILPVQVPRGIIEPLFQQPFRTTRRNGPVNMDPPEMEFFADNQNVHNNTIQKSIKQQYNSLQSETNINVADEIDKWTNSDEKISDIINQIKVRNSPITNLNMDTEMNILSKVWANAKDDNERNAIIDELRDSVNEQGDIYCPTGVSVRLVNSTWINKPEDMPKTKSMIHEEMMNSASSIRTLLEANDDYTKKNDEEKDTVFKETILERYNQDYTGILTENEIAEMTSEWIDLV
jgi:hypothetical protein